jgi:Rad3-related DNA helicase
MIVKKVKSPATIITSPPTDPRLDWTPARLGFDQNRFPAYRNLQLETALLAADSSVPLFLIEAPTGSGKSLCGLTIPKTIQYKAFNEKQTESTGKPKLIKGFYLCSTKQLQDQIVTDFNIPLLKGRANYPCAYMEEDFPEVTAEICSFLKNTVFKGPCPMVDRCPYIRAKAQVMQSNMAVLNYSLFLTEVNHIGQFAGRDVLIMDEVDTVEDQLMSYIEVSVSRTMQNRLSLGRPRYKTKPESWKEWLCEAQQKVESYVCKYATRADLSPREMKAIMAYERLAANLDKLGGGIDDTWVMEMDDKDDNNPHPSMVFKPVKIDKYANEYLWQHAGKHVGMSATIMGHQAMALDYGMEPWSAGFTSLPSPFPVANRQVKYIPVADVSYKNKIKAYPLLATAINKLLKKHAQEKTLIHAVSYDLMKYLVDNVSSATHRKFFHNQENRVAILNDFKAYQGPAVLISPSMDRGVDLPGDLCRVVIVAKLPFPSLASLQVSRRLYGSPDGSSWYARRTARTLIQMTGRATRAKNDFSISYILDEQFGHLVQRNGDIFPSWWREAVSEGSLD